MCKGFYFNLMEAGLAHVIICEILKYERLAVVSLVFWGGMGENKHLIAYMHFTFKVYCKHVSEKHA